MSGVRARFWNTVARVNGIDRRDRGSRAEHLKQGVGDIVGRFFLQNQPGCRLFDQAGEAAESHDTPGGLVGDVGATHRNREVVGTNHMNPHVEHADRLGSLRIFDDLAERIAEISALSSQQMLIPKKCGSGGSLFELRFAGPAAGTQQGLEGFDEDVIP